MWRIALRRQRAGIVGMVVFGVVYGLIQTAGYFSAAGNTAASRTAFGNQIATFGRTFSYLLPLPVRADTVGGYLQWRVYGALPLIFVFWALLSATGAARGDEDRGLVEEWLTTGVGKVRYLASRWLAFVLALAAAVAATSATTDLLVIQNGSSLPLSSLVEMSVALLALTLSCYGVALVASQVASSRRASAGVGGAVLLVAFFLNGFSRTASSLRGVARFTPFHYYDLSSPLTPGGTFDVTATVGLAIAGVILAGVAAWLMSRRDLGAAVVRRHVRKRPVSHDPSPNPLLRLPVISGLYEQRLALTAWVLGAAGGAAFMASIARQMVNLTNGSGPFRNYLTLAGHGDPYVALTGFFWFGIFEMLLAAFAIVQVSRWASDDEQGRLETILSAPVSRTRVVLERAVLLVVDSVLIIGFSSVAFWFGARGQGIHIPAGGLTTASAVLVPYVLSLAAVGALLASRVPRATVGVLGSLAFLSYLITEGGPLLKMPHWTLKLSIFSLYGTPLTDGVYWTGLWILLAVTLGGFGLGALLMQRREVGA